MYSTSLNKIVNRNTSLDYALGIQILYDDFIRFTACWRDVRDGIFYSASDVLSVARDSN